MKDFLPLLSFANLQKKLYHSISFAHKLTPGEHVPDSGALRFSHYFEIIQHEELYNS